MKGTWEMKSLSGQLVCGIKGIAQVMVAYLYHTQQLNIFPKPSLFIIMPLIMPFLLPRKLLPLPQILFLQLANSYPPLEPVERSVGASLVAQWLRICLPIQGTRVQALVWEDPTCRRATGPMSHNY